MLGRTSYTQGEVDHARTAVDQQLATYRRLAAALAGAGDEVAPALAALEARFFTDLVLVLDRYFVHRLRKVTGKDGNPLNEVELLTESLLNNDGVLRGNNVVKYVPAESVLKLEIGDRIRLSADDFERLSKAFFAELGRKFL
jgi:hypothetical protein